MKRRATFSVRLICCGRDDGSVTFENYEAAEAFRESYLTGAGVAEHQLWETGHRRAAIIEQATE